ncbi:hypothetical protein [Streptomyces sp. WG-D5]
MTTLPDGRPVPPVHADERATLEGWLDFLPPVHATGGPNAFTLTPDRTLPDALAQWRTEITRSRALTPATTATRTSCGRRIGGGVTAGSGASWVAGGPGKVA